MGVKILCSQHKQNTALTGGLFTQAISILLNSDNVATSVGGQSESDMEERVKRKLKSAKQAVEVFPAAEEKRQLQLCFSHQGEVIEA